MPAWFETFAMLTGFVASILGIADFIMRYRSLVKVTVRGVVQALGQAFVVGGNLFAGIMLIVVGALSISADAFDNLSAKELLRELLGRELPPWFGLLLLGMGIAFTVRIAFQWRRGGWRNVG